MSADTPDHAHRQREFPGAREPAYAREHTLAIQKQLGKAFRTLFTDDAHQTLPADIECAMARLESATRQKNTGT